MPHRTNVHNQTPTEWTVTGTSASPGAQTLTKAAETNRRHFVCGLHISASAEVVGMIFTITDNAVAVFIGYAVDEGTNIDFGNHPLEISEGSALTATVATGGGAIVTKATMWGYTLGAK